jgi:hypothetical protein
MTSAIYIACALLALSGIVLFLYGANYYNNIVGWTGVYLFAAALVIALVAYTYRHMKTR